MHGVALATLDVAPREAVRRGAARDARRERRGAVRLRTRERRRFDGFLGRRAHLDRLEGHDIERFRQTGYERPQRAIVVVQIRSRRLAHPFGGHRADALGEIVVEAPAADRFELAETLREAERSVAGERALHVDLRLRALDFHGVGALVRKRFQHAFDLAAHLLRGDAGPDVRDHLKESGIARTPVPRRRFEREPRVDERAREAARATAAEHAREHVERVRVVLGGRRGGARREIARREHRSLAERGGRVERERDDRRVAGPLHHHAALAGLRRLFGVHVGNRVRGAWQRAEGPLDRRERSLRIEIADDERGRVVRMIERVVEFAQPLGGHAFHVGAPADRRMMVRMLAEGGGHERGAEDARGVVVVALELVTHDGHLGAPVGVGDERAAHAIRFEFDRELQVLRRYGLEIVRAVDPGGRVLRGPDLVHDVGEGAADAPVVGRRPLEEHVLEEVRGTGVAHRFVACAHVIDDEQRGHGRRRGRYEHHFETVFQKMFLRRKWRTRYHSGKFTPSLANPVAHEVRCVLSAALPAFLASLVEFVEALTIVLAVAATRGWRSAGIGSAAAVALLALLVLAFGPALGRVPLGTLQIVVGILLLFFGLRWLRKAVLRYAGSLAMKDEAQVYERRVTGLRAAPLAGAGFDWLGTGTAFNAVVLEGFEVIFIVIAVGATAGALVPASLGAALAGIVVIAAGVALRAPLARVPENALKFLVGIMLSAFGTFWTGEGFGFAWQGDDLALLALAGGYLAAAAAAFALARRPGAAQEAAR